MPSGYCYFCGHTLDERRALCPGCARPAKSATAGTQPLASAAATAYVGTDPGRTSDLPRSGASPISDTLPYGEPSDPPTGADTIPGYARDKSVAITTPSAGGAPVAKTIAMPDGEIDQMLADMPTAEQLPVQPSAGAGAVITPGPVAGSPVTKSQAMTFVAGEGLGLARMFNQLLSQPWPGWRAELLEPQEPSTAAGRHARQHISIIGPSGSRVSIGRVDTLHKTVQLRTHEMVSEMWAQRFGQPFPVTSEQYRSFIGIASHLLTGAGLAVTHEIPTISVMPPPEVAPSRDNSTLWLVMVLCVAVLLALLIYSRF